MSWLLGVDICFWLVCWLVVCARMMFGFVGCVEFGWIVSSFIDLGLPIELICNVGEVRLLYLDCSLVEWFVNGMVD